MRTLLASSFRRPGVVIGCSLLIPLGVYLWSSSLQPVFTASAQLTFHLPALEQDLVRVLELEPQALPSANVLPDTVVAAEPNARASIEERVARDIRGIASDDVRRAVDFGPVEPAFGTAVGSGTRGVRRIVASADEPRAAAKLANGFAKGYAEFRLQSLRQRVADIRALNRVRGATLGADGSSRARRASIAAAQPTLELLEFLAATSVSFERAPVPSSQASPRPVRNTFVAAAFGMWLGITLASLLERGMPRLSQKPSRQPARKQDAR